MTDIDAITQNIQAEQAVLGVVLLEGGVINQVFEILTPEDFYTRVYFLENEWKTKMENYKPLLITCNHSENINSEKSFSKTRNSGKLNGKVENEKGGEPDDENIDQWDIEEETGEE